LRDAPASLYYVECSIVRSLAKSLVVLLILVGLFSYLILPGLIEDQIAGRLQTAIGTPTKPVVTVSSRLPLMMLLGRFDRVQVSMDVEAPPIFINQNQACLNYLGLGTLY
jgi:hypothetical protein